MSDGQRLYLVFALFYLVECLHWLPLGSVVLRTWRIRRGWGIARPSDLCGARGSGLMMAWPVPWFGGFLPTQPWAVIPTDDGCWVGPSQPHPCKWLSWAEAEPAVDQRRVQLAPGIALACDTPRTARLLHAFLCQAKAAAPGEARAAVVQRYWQRSLSLRSAKLAAHRYRLATGIMLLRLPQAMAAFLCFVHLPFLYWRFSDNLLQLGVAVAAILLCTSMIAFTWRALHRHCYREEPGGRWGRTLQMIVLPTQAMRAHDSLGLELFAGLHPIVAAAALLPRARALELASSTWRGWRYRHADDPLYAMAQAVLPHLEKTTEQLGYTPTELEPAPPAEHGAASYCPRCHTQFTAATTTCPSCRGIAAKPF